MAIKSIKISNFKSYSDLEVEFGAFNVLIGANASGKSNFVQVFRFVRDMVNLGLQNAVSMQGGSRYLTSISIGSSRDLAIRVISEQDYALAITHSEDTGLVGVGAKETAYEFAIASGNGGGVLQITKDKLMLKCECVELKREEDRIVEIGGVGYGEVTLSNIDGKLVYRSTLPEGLGVEKEDIFGPLLGREDTEPLKGLLAETPFFTYPFFPHETFLHDISIYDFDPKLPKKAIPITGRRELEEDGSNLAIVLRSILEDQENRRRFLNLLKDVLGFIDDLEVMPLMDGSLLLGSRETYTRGKLLPASFLSEGTIHVIALIIALYFDDHSLIIIEEPERSIHPFLIAKVVGMMKEASEKKQIIITTHNPEVVRHAGLDNLLLVSRDKDGFSTISRPSESAELKEFLKNEIGLDELFVQDLLGALT